MTNEMTVDVQLDEQIEEALKNFSGSPYQLSKITSLLVGRYVREQQIYSYVNKNMIVGTKIDGKWNVSKESASVFLHKFVPKHKIEK